MSKPFTATTEYVRLAADQDHITVRWSDPRTGGRKFKNVPYQADSLDPHSLAVILAIGEGRVVMAEDQSTRPASGYVWEVTL